MESQSPGGISKGSGRHPFKAWLREGGGYFVVGIMQVVVDFSMFVALTYSGVGTVPANVVGRITGASLGFWLNGRYTFAERGARLGAIPLLRYLATWILMTLLSTVLVSAADAHVGLAFAWIAKPVIDLSLAAAGFLISRHWIYK